MKSWWVRRGVQVVCVDLTPIETEVYWGEAMPALGEVYTILETREVPPEFCDSGEIILTFRELPRLSDSYDRFFGYPIRWFAPLVDTTKQVEELKQMVQDSLSRQKERV